MRPIVFLLATWLALPAASAGSRNPFLKLLSKSTRLEKALQPAAGTILGGPAQVLRVAALVETRDVETTAAAVRARGDHAGRPIGSILPVFATPATLTEIERLNEVLRIEASPPRQIVLDLSRPDVRVQDVEAGNGLPLPITGQGVIAALVDTGVDYDHADFGGARGRVLAIWDQFAASGEPPPGKDVGAYCDRSRILKETCDSSDFVGHGTHVAATMAAEHPDYRGMAPDAEILAVASIDFGLLVESVEWLFDEGEKLGKPVVVNLSLGGHYGPHDGTSLESIALSGLTGPGKIIVAAAGNEGADYIHLGYDPGGETRRTLFHVFSGFDVSAALFTIWFAADVGLEFSIGCQKGWEDVAASDFFAPEDGSRVIDLADGNTQLGRLYFEAADGPNPENGKLQVDIAVEPGEAAYAENPDGYVWYIEVRGNGYFDAWSAASGFLTPPARFSDLDSNNLVPGDNQRTIGMPAVAAGVIAVASYATRSNWTDDRGEQIDHPETSPGNISFFSSRGPSADTDLTGYKPLVAAPGEYIVAALSEHSSSLEEGTKIDPEHIAMRGTSMACPHVAGIVALLLEADGDLDPDGVRRILAATARSDEHTGSDLPNYTWGWGKVDAFEAVAMALGVGVCESDADCAEGYACRADGRCAEEGSGGCSCGRQATSPGACFLFLVLLLVGLSGNRKRASG